MPKAAAAKKSEQPASYEAALQELEQLIAQIESGQLPLEQMLSGYQRAAELLVFAAASSMPCRSRSRYWTKASCLPGPRTDPGVRAFCLEDAAHE